MKILKFALVIALVASFVGCNDIFQQNIDKNVSKVTVSLDGNFRTILPNLGTDGFSKIEIHAESTGADPIDPVDITATGAGSLTVPYGEWEIIATAFLDVDGDDYAAVSDSVTLTVEDPTHNVEIFLDTPTEGGEGTFAYKIEFPAGAEVSVTLRNWPLAEDTPPIIDGVIVGESGQGSQNVSSGFYFLTVTAKIDDKHYVQNQIVHIYHDRVSTAELEFVGEEEPEFMLPGDETLVGEDRIFTLASFLADNPEGLAAPIQISGSPTITVIDGGINITNREESWDALDINISDLDVASNIYQITVSGHILGTPPSGAGIVMGQPEDPWSWLSNQDVTTENQVFNLGYNLPADYTQNRVRIQANDEGINMPFRITSIIIRDLVPRGGPYVPNPVTPGDYSVKIEGLDLKNPAPVVGNYQTIWFNLASAFPTGFNIANYDKFTVKAKFYDSDNVEITVDDGLGQFRFATGTGTEWSGWLHEAIYNLGTEETIGIEIPVTFNATPTRILVQNSSATVAFIEITEITFHGDGASDPDPIDIGGNLGNFDREYVDYDENQEGWNLSPDLRTAIANGTLNALELYIDLSKINNLYGINVNLNSGGGWSGGEFPHNYISTSQIELPLVFDLRTHTGYDDFIANISGGWGQIIIGYYGYVDGGEPRTIADLHITEANLIYIDDGGDSFGKQSDGSWTLDPANFEEYGASLVSGNMFSFNGDYASVYYLFPTGEFNINDYSSMEIDYFLTPTEEAPHKITVKAISASNYAPIGGDSDATGKDVQYSNMTGGTSRLTVSSNFSELADLANVSGFALQQNTYDGDGNIPSNNFNLQITGIRLLPTPEPIEVGDTVIEYAVDFRITQGNVAYICVYGWTTGPDISSDPEILSNDLIEYYIIESRGSQYRPGTEYKGTANINGNIYELYVARRSSQPSIHGNRTFNQYFSIRQDSNWTLNTDQTLSGTIDVSAHFQAWENAGMKMGPTLTEVAFCVEGFQSAGTANVTKNILKMNGVEITGSDGSLPNPHPITGPSSPTVDVFIDGIYRGYNYEYWRQVQNLNGGSTGTGTMTLTGNGTNGGAFNAVWGGDPAAYNILLRMGKKF